MYPSDGSYSDKNELERMFGAFEDCHAHEIGFFANFEDMAPVWFPVMRDWLNGSFVGPSPSTPSPATPHPAPVPPAPTPSVPVPAPKPPPPADVRIPDGGWKAVPLFAHFRYANFTAEEYAAMQDSFRLITVQGTWFGSLSGEMQAERMRANVNRTIIFYSNGYFAEPYDDYFSNVSSHDSWQLRDADGTILKPEGKLVYNMTVPAVPEFWADVVSGVVARGYADGGFCDKCCGEQPSWMTAEQQQAYAAAQWEAQALSQQKIGADRLMVSNCPFLLKDPTGHSELWPAGVRGTMYQSWCSDFLTGQGGGENSLYCRDEVMSMLAGPAAWQNGSVALARYYLSGHNGEDPRFGAVAFLIAAFDGAFFGASTDWNWSGDWDRIALPRPDWTTQPLGQPAPPVMLDSSGCSWNRSFASGASAFVNFCMHPGHPKQAIVHWADGTTWPSEGGQDQDWSEELVASRSDVALPPLSHRFRLRSVPAAAGASHSGYSGCRVGRESPIWGPAGEPLCLSLTTE